MIVFLVGYLILMFVAMAIMISFINAEWPAKSAESIPEAIEKDVNDDIVISDSEILIEVKNG
jgi:hypothetical protein